LVGDNVNDSLQLNLSSQWGTGDTTIDASNRAAFQHVAGGSDLDTPEFIIIERLVAVSMTSCGSSKAVVDSTPYGITAMAG
jgi:hypothetical protein